MQNEKATTTDNMKQKFKIETFVHISEDAHPYGGYDGIIHGSYSQLYGGSNVQSYSVYILKGKRVINIVSWYEEDDLTELEKQDREKAEELIEKYNCGNEDEDNEEIT
jgi:hypothetical protein